MEIIGISDEEKRFHWKDCIIRLQVSEDEGRSWSKSRELFHFQDIDAIKIKKGI